MGSGTGEGADFTSALGAGASVGAAGTASRADSTVFVRPRFLGTSVAFFVSDKLVSLMGSNFILIFNF